MTISEFSEEVNLPIRKIRWLHYKRILKPAYYCYEKKRRGRTKGIYTGEHVRQVREYYARKLKDELESKKLDYIDLKYV